MAGNKDRQRRVAREKYRRQQEQRLVRRQQVRKRTLTVTGILAGLGLVLGLVLSFAVPGSKPVAQPSATPSTSPTATATATPTTVREPATHCTYTPVTTASLVAKKVPIPPSTPDYTTVSYLATIKTNLGTMKMNLLNSKATCTVSSFVSLAKAGYFNNTQCHRVVNSGIYVLQCGDAFATANSKLTCASTSKIGSGTPGYQYASENLTGAKYPAGTVAMANSGTATSNGSQFFIVYQDSSAGLQPLYTPFGTVSSGLNIVQNVAKDGLSCTFTGAGGGPPKQRVVIDSVTIQKA